MFNKYTITDFKANLFNELSTNVNYENITKGRKGTNIVDIRDNNMIPLVRTTTVYNEASQKMLQIHYNIIEKIKNVSGISNLVLNNALIEIYNSEYCNMGFHTDQSLDLQDNSFICIFSCYKNENGIKSERKLYVKNKENGNTEIVNLSHNSVIIFDTETNKKHIHKIILENYDQNDKNEWLGITFRCSKRFIKFIDDIPYIYPNDVILRLANENEKKSFLREKGIENKISTFVYTEFDYTLSIGDLINPL